jgi:hypothetical protein
MDNETMLEYKKMKYRALVKFKRNYLSRGKRKMLLSRDSIASLDGETIQVIASTLCDWEVLTIPKHVLDFFEKPWKWETEICLLYQIIDNQLPDDLHDNVTTFISKCLDKQLGEYWTVIDLINEEITDVKDEIEFYKEAINA